MTNRLSFSTCDLLHDVPTICGVCAAHPPIFRYTFYDGDEKERAEVGIRFTHRAAMGGTELKPTPQSMGCW